jgi:hypothetical protein
MMRATYLSEAAGTHLTALGVYSADRPCLHLENLPRSVTVEVQLPPSLPPPSTRPVGGAFDAKQKVTSIYDSRPARQDINKDQQQQRQQQNLQTTSKAALLSPLDTTNNLTEKLAASLYPSSVLERRSVYLISPLVCCLHHSSPPGLLEIFSTLLQRLS